MTRENRFLVSAAVIAAYAFVMYAAARFFLNGHSELMSACSRYAATDCFANDSIVVSAVSLRIGIVVFFLMGTFAWAVASYLGFRWWSMRNIGPLP